jgi:hypothetical protein
MVKQLDERPAAGPAGGPMLDLDKIVAGAFVPNRRRTDVERSSRRVVEEAPDLAATSGRDEHSRQRDPTHRADGGSLLRRGSSITPGTRCG